MHVFCIFVVARVQRNWTFHMERRSSNALIITIIITIIIIIMIIIIFIIISNTLSYQVTVFSILKGDHWLLMVAL